MAVSTEERRIVTVLFADMAGSTALGEELDPEEMRRLLARYYGIARECVEQHGGTVEKFIGDAVMAVFGLPSAHGDDPDRAVAAALMMRDRIREDELLNGRLAIRFGVSTGEVVASRDQSAGDFLITGDATNVAARLQQEAEPWAILASDRTVRAANNFEFGDEIEVRARQIGARAGAARDRAKEGQGPAPRPPAAHGPRERPGAISARRPSCGHRKKAGVGQRHRTRRRGQDEVGGGVHELAAEPGSRRDGGHRTVPALRTAAHVLADAPGHLHAHRYNRGHGTNPGPRGDWIVAARRRGGERGQRYPAPRGDDRRGRHRRRRQRPPLCRLAVGHRGHGAPPPSRDRFRGPALA